MAENKNSTAFPFPIDQIDYSDAKAVLRDPDKTYAGLLARFKEVDPDFDETHFNLVFDLLISMAAGRAKMEDFETGGRFADEIMDPIMEEMSEWLKKEAAWKKKEAEWKKQFADKKFVFVEVGDNLEDPLKIEIPYAKAADVMREVNPELTDHQFDLAIDLFNAYFKNTLKPEELESGARFDRKMLTPALKEVFKALEQEEKYEVIKEILKL